MAQDKISALIKKAGFKSKVELAQALGISKQTIYNWGQEAPAWLEVVCEWARKARAYDELMQKIKDN